MSTKMHRYTSLELRALTIRSFALRLTYAYWGHDLDAMHDQAQRLRSSVVDVRTALSGMGPIDLVEHAQRQRVRSILGGAIEHIRHATARHSRVAQTTPTLEAHILHRAGALDV